MPTVSIVIPTYNHRDFVGLTLESVRAQTFRDYEVIVVNDGSPDDTDAAIQPFVESGFVSRYIRQTNAGQGAARNRGIAEAKGEFVLLLDDDDIIPPDKLAWQVAGFAANPGVGVVYGYADPIDAHGAPTAPRNAYNLLPDWPRDAPTGNVYHAMTKRSWLVSPGQALIRRSVMSSPAFDPALRGCDDWDLWLRLAERWEFVFEKRVALFYRLHDANASRDTLTMRRSDFHLLTKHLLRNVGMPRRFALVAHRLASFLRSTPYMMREQAARDIEAGRLDMARAKLRYAARLRPDWWLNAGFRALWQRAN